MTKTERTVHPRWTIPALALITAAALAAPFLVAARPWPLRDRHSQPSLAAPAATTVSQVVVAEAGKLFHDPRCPYVHGRPLFVDRAVAEARGYSPCPRCLGAWHSTRP